MLIWGGGNVADGVECVFDGNHVRHSIPYMYMYVYIWYIYGIDMVLSVCSTLTRYLGPVLDA